MTVNLNEGSRSQNRHLSTKDKLRLGLAATVLTAILSGCAPIDWLAGRFGYAPKPTPTPTPKPTPALVIPDAQKKDTAKLQVVTVEQALWDAAANNAQKTKGNVQELYQYITEIYGSLPADMPFVAPGTKGLLPHETQATSMAGPAPSKDANKPSYYVQASMRGYYAVSGGYLFAVTGDGYKLELPWQDKTTQNVYFIGSLDKNTPVGLYDYAPGGTFGTGASYSEGQQAQFPDRKMIDKVWLADGIMQAALRDGPGGKTVVSFVDTASHAVTQYTYDISGKNWAKQTYGMAKK